MKHYQKIISAVTAVSLCLMGLCFWTPSVQADDVQKVVVIGDGISTGAGLAEGEKSYVEWLDYYTDVQIQNFAQDSYTTADILQCLDDAQIQEALSQADIILVTAGIQDIMQPFLEVANSYMSEFGFVKFTDVFTASLAEHGIDDENELVPYSNRLSDAAASNKEAAGENFRAITENLSQYQNAKIIYQTVYNSTNTIENLESLSMRRQFAYRSVCNPITSIVNETFNTYLAELDGQGTCLVVDTFAGFEGYAYHYTNLNDLDANPNADGHIWIADAVIEKAGLEKKEPPEETTTEESTETTTETATTETTTETTTAETTTETTTTETITETTTAETTTETATTETTTETTTAETTTETATTETTTQQATSAATTQTTVSQTETSPETTASEPVQNTFQLGDLNGDNTVNASDAAILLTAAANIGVGKPSGLSSELQLTVDFNHDGKINSSDAAFIQVYAAGRGSNKITVSFEAYLKTR